jgi:enoyl-CoA hydratase/carnithine racemase
MKTLGIEYRQHVVIVKLNKGITNSINLELVNELAEALHAVKGNPEARSLVLGSANDKFFSIGFDIPYLIGLSRQDFSTFYLAYNQLCLDLYTLPIATVAAITGHAVAGGCILTLCCDYRYIAEGHKLMGLNEIKLGVPVPFPGDCILQQIIGARYAREVMESGDFYSPEELSRIGMVDKVVPLEKVLSYSVEKALTLGAFPPVAYAGIKVNRVERVADRIRSNLAEKEDNFIELWYSEQTRERLEEALEKF